MSVSKLTGCRQYGLLAVLTGLAACSSAACRPAPATPAAATPSIDTWAVVDGREIMRAEVDQAFRRTQDPSQTPSEEEILTAKLSLLNDIILQDILLAKARALNLTVAAADLDKAYDDGRKNLSDEAFQQELTRRGMTPTDVREGLRRELLTRKLLAQDVESKVAVTDQEVTAAFNASRAQFNLAEESYRIAQIVVTAGRDAQIANTTGDDANTPQEALAKVQMLMEKLKGGASFQDLATSYSEDPESAPRGGDLGLVPMSKLKQAPPTLRDAVLNKAPGSVNVAAGGGGYTLVLVAGHEPAGQRDLTTPGVRDSITEALRARKDGLLRTAYLTAARSDAVVVNYLARRLVQSKGTLPSLQPAAPGARR